MIEKFRFTEWPFAMAPTRERAVALWADRKRAAEQISTTIEHWRVTGNSTINLLWADLGSGKTHTLYHLGARCAAAGFIPIYVVLPTTITKFAGLYRVIADALEWPTISALLPANASSRTASQLRRVLDWRTSDIDTRRRSLAERWLLGERLTQAQCDALGVSSWISTSDDAVEILRLAISALSSTGSRVVLMIDEYQRVAEGSRRHLQDIGHAIHTLYNACPMRFTLLLSCAMGSSEDYGLVLTPELLSRLSTHKIDLSYLTTEDILDYLRDLFAHYRLGEAVVDAYFPISRDLAAHTAELLREELRDEVTPRKLNEAFGNLLSWANQHVITPPITKAAFKRWRDNGGLAAVRRLRE